MQKRNFILLIIILIVIVAAFFGFLYFREKQTTPGEEGEGTNFISQFNPFGRPAAEVALPVAVPDGTDSTPVNIGTGTVKLEKVSSMGIAGYTVFTKERLKVIPTPTTPPSIPYNFGSTTLKNGSQGEAVKEIQRFFNDTLNLHFELDGILDTVVVAAAKDWQSKHGLTADGIIGAKTKTAMYLSVNQTTGSTVPLTEFMPALRYVDKITGNIYQTFADKIEEQKFSKTIIPRIYEAYFGSHGETVTMRYLKADERTIETFVGNLPKELLEGDMTGNNEIKGVFLPNNVKDISVSPDGSKIFYLFENENNMVGTTLNFLNNNKTQLFASPFTEWLSLWPTNNTITLSTKPSASVPGYMYTIDSAGKNLNKVFGDINGLTTLGGPNNKLFLFGDNNLSLSIYNRDTRNSDVLGIKTLPEKCVWGKTGDTIYCAVPKSITSAEYPDAWYQGEVSFSDSFWKIDTKIGNATLILDPTTVAGSEEIDGIKLSLDEGENYLFFVNKKDSLLWKINLR